MDWGTLAAAALGAVFGSGATLLTDAVRARREHNREWADTKRQVYTRFLVALTQAHSRIVVAAFKDQTAEERRQAVHEAFHRDPQHAEAKSVLRELAITAPDGVYTPASQVYERLRVMRDTLAQVTLTVDDQKYDDLNRSFFTSLEELQVTMRSDLRSS